MAQMRIGFSKADITPPLGTELGGPVAIENVTSDMVIDRILGIVPVP